MGLDEVQGLLGQGGRPIVGRGSKTLPDVLDQGVDYPQIRTGSGVAALSIWQVETHRRTAGGHLEENDQHAETA